MRNSLVEVCNILVLQTKELLVVAMNVLCTKNALISGLIASGKCNQNTNICKYCYGIGTHFQTFWRMEPP